MRYAPSGTALTVGIRRRVVKDGLFYGVAHIYVSSSTWRTATRTGETLRLCPYYDPVKRALRFRQSDGLDSIEEKFLAELIGRNGCYTLLHLAHAENLIDKVPCQFWSLTLSRPILV